MGASIETETVKELLRRMVLLSNDGYHRPILALLKAAGYDVPDDWAQVTRNQLRVYCGGQEPDKPEVVDRLIADLGGTSIVGFQPGDSGWYEWHWEAEVV